MPAPVMDWPANLTGAIEEIAARQGELDREAAQASAREIPRKGAATPAHPAEAAPPAAFADMSRLERQLRTITERIESLRRPCGAEEALIGLRHELAEFGRRLNEALPRHVLESFRSEIRALGERIEIGARDAADAPALAGIERGLGEIRTALDALTPAENLGDFGEAVEALSRRIELAGVTGSEPESPQQLERAVAELRRLAGQIASGDAVSALAGQIQMIGDRLDRFTAQADRVADIEQRGIEQVEQLAQRMETLAVSIESRAGEAVTGVPTHLEQLIRTLTDKLEASRSWGGDHAGFEQLEQRIIALAHKLDASDARLGSLSATERNIADLIVQLKGARAAAIEAAEATARAVAHEMLHPRAGSEGDVAELRHDVAELRTTQADIDRRTAGALEAVHDTLKRLVKQMASVESDTSPPPPSPVIGWTEPQSQRNVQREPAARWRQLQPAGPPPVPPDRRPGPDPAFAANAPPIQPRQALDPMLPGDHPLEPGSGSPRRIAATPAERIAAAGAAVASLKPPGPELSAQASFIAAARRAAMAAAESAERTGRAAGATTGGRLGVIGPTLINRRGKLIIGTAVVVIILVTLHLVTGMLHGGQEARVEPQRPQTDVTVPARPDARKSEAPQSAAPQGGTSAETAPPSESVLLAETGRSAGSDGRSQATPDADLLLSPVPIMGPVAASANGRDGNARKAPATSAAAGTARDAGTGRDMTASPHRQRRASEPAAAQRHLIAAARPGQLPDSIGGPALRAAATHDDPAAAFEIAVRYAEGRGVPQSFEGAARWLERAANHGLAPAQFRLGGLYEKGQGVTKDLEKARRLYTAAAEKGNGKAMHNLAVLYAEGVDGKPDYPSAAQWFRRAAERGVADSQYNLAILYARGIGVEQNLAESYKWFSLAAQQGDKDAANKRDDVAARLDPQSLTAARLATQTWTANPQPDDAINVKVPAKGWDAPGSAPATSPGAHHVGRTQMPTAPRGETHS